MRYQAAAFTRGEDEVTVLQILDRVAGVNADGNVAARDSL
jgi:hypothetical protein